VKKIFGNLRCSINYEDYCNYLIKFFNMDRAQCKELFLPVLDMNKDKLICETDMFRVLKSLTSMEMLDLIEEDFVAVIKAISFQRVAQSKHNNTAIIRNESSKNALKALKDKKLVEKINYNYEIKLFLKEIGDH
jgi:hypothetical protein